MRKYSHLGKGLVSFLALFLVSCESFIPDPVDPRLSMYTEKGLNVSSALVNDRAWKAEPDFFAGWGFGLLPNHDLTYQPLNDTLFLEMKGKRDSTSAAITFIFTKLGITNLQDMNQFRDRKFSIDGKTISATYNSIPAGEGQIYFKHAQANDSTAVLSGTFGFTTHNPVLKVSYGRFDIRIRKEVNFRVKN